MKKLLVIISVAILIPVTGLAQAKPLEIVNNLNEYVTIKFQVDGCSGFSTDVPNGETMVYQVKSNAFYKITLFYYDNDRERTVYLLKNSTIPYYAKKKPVKGTKITVNSKISINPASDISYGDVGEVTFPIGCRKR